MTRQFDRRLAVRSARWLGAPVFSRDGACCGESSRHRVIIGCLLAIVAAHGPEAVRAQPLALLGSPTEAVVGEPFGVGRVTLRLPANASPQQVALATRAIFVTESQQRLHYPAISTGGPLDALRGLLTDASPAEAGPDDTPANVTVTFLFTGSEPLQVRVEGVSSETHRLTPMDNPRSHRRLMRQWWRQYHQMLDQQRRSADYLPDAELYLTRMLQWRLQLPPPLLSDATLRPIREPSPGRKSLDLLLRTDAMRQAVLAEALATDSPAREVADVALPDPTPSLTTAAMAADDPLARVAIEPIAQVVPADCFSVRFGDFTNYLWLTHLLEDYGGNLAQMIRQRGQHDAKNKRVQQQLALEESALTEILGPQVIADVALIGHDFYLAEGAGIGILFEARNPLLGLNISQQRSAALKRFATRGATLSDVTIADQKVSFLSTPSNELRSFYAVSGSYHLVTTSRAVMEGFLRASAGKNRLGDLPEFRQARREMPLARQDTVWVYLSRPFFQHLSSPHYQVELRRRLRSAIDQELLQFARLAGRAEGTANGSVTGLVDRQLLPHGFGQYPDGSRIVEAETDLTDSLRGKRGTYLPIGDVPLSRVTPQEAREIAEWQEFQQQSWPEMDPVLVGVRRRGPAEAPQDGKAAAARAHERLEIDAHVSPFHQKQYGTIVSLLGEPTKDYVAGPNDDLLHIHAVVRGGSWDPTVGPHHLFVGLRDGSPEPTKRRIPFLATMQTLRSLPGYLGAWPQFGLLDNLALGDDSQPDPQGYSEFPLGLVRRQFEDFSVLSFSRDVLETATPQIRVVQDEEEAQIRLRVADLAGTRISDWVNSRLYQRCYKASLGNVQFFHLLTQQLGVPTTEALQVAQGVLGVELVCPLGGSYRWREQAADQPAGWGSSAWPQGHAPSADEVPDTFQAPPLQWFRGASARVVMRDNHLVVHADLTIERRERDAQGKVPWFPFFGSKTPMDKNRDNAPAPTAGR